MATQPHGMKITYRQLEGTDHSQDMGEEVSTVASRIDWAGDIQSAAGPSSWYLPSYHIGQYSLGVVHQRKPPSDGSLCR